MDPRAPSCSSHPLTPDQVSVTLATQTSENRLWMMEHHCARWGKQHYISLAVHTRKTQQEIMEELKKMGCDITYLIVNTVPPMQPLRTEEYPINQMRNVAIAAATKTSHIFYVDIDFWTSKDLSLAFDSAYVRQALSEDDRLALVVPALAIYRRWCENDDGCDDMNVERMPMDASDKSKISIMAQTRELTMFDPYNPAGHQSTGYHEWFRQKKGELRDISCIRSNRYEPYVVFRRCDFLPPFQEAFTGYGKNKMTWSMHIRRAGYKFKVLDEGFVVHFPHIDSASRISWNKRPKLLRNMMRPAQLDGMGVHIDWKAFKRGQIDSLYLDFKAWLRENVKDESRVGLCSDVDGSVNDDDEKLWIEQSRRGGGGKN